MFSTKFIFELSNFYHLKFQISTAWGLIFTFKKRVDFDRCLGWGREGSLRSLTGGSKTSNSAFVSRNVFLIFSLEFLNKVVNHAVIKVFSAEMSVSSGWLDLENSVFDWENGDIKGSAAEIKDENVALSSDFFVETVGDGSSSGFVDDAQNVDARDSASILGSLTLKIDK